VGFRKETAFAKRIDFVFCRCLCYTSGCTRFTKTTTMCLFITLNIVLWLLKW